MNTNRISTKSKEQWIKEVQERLDWYTFQASEEEFDAQEVEALVALLETLKAGTAEQMPEPKVDFEAFMRYQEEKSADAGQLAALHNKAELKAELKVGLRTELMVSEDSKESAETTKSTETAESTGDLDISWDDSKSIMADGRTELSEIPDSTKSVSRSAGKIWGGSHRFIKIASVAAILVALTVGGTLGAVNAAKGGDYILWLRRDKEGEKLVIVPQKNTLNQAKQDVGSVYYNIEDVPEKYGQYLMDFDEMENLEGYDLSRIEVSKYGESWLMSSLLQAGEQEVGLGVRVYEDYVAVQENSFNDYECVYSREMDGREFMCYQKTGNTEGWDVMICFYDKSTQYFVYGNSSIEALEALALEYAEKVF